MEVEAATAEEALREVARLGPALEAHLFDAGGELRSGVNVYLRDTEVRRLDEEERRLDEGDELLVVPGIAGG